MPAAATATDIPIRRYSVAWETSCGWETASDGARNFRKTLWPPRTSGKPRNPSPSEPAARIQSGTVIVAGDSWMCPSASFDPRKVP